MVAGLTVALTVIPQGIADAALAGLPTEYGLYAGFMGNKNNFFLELFLLLALMKVVSSTSFLEAARISQ